ncbi:MAG: iron-containing alcohol dehydrogenase [Opitutaceae bacterium]|nr:iron-containing alcohol dehydrogenase [Opitutaceae bacterium]
MAMGFGFTSSGDPLDFLAVVGRGQPLAHAAPCLAIPTTGCTASEVTHNPVLASPLHRANVSLRPSLTLPRVALVDPELTLDLPPPITAATGPDALTQLIEPYLSHPALAESLGRARPRPERARGRGAGESTRRPHTCQLGPRRRARARRPDRRHVSRPARNRLRRTPIARVGNKFPCTQPACAGIVRPPSLCRDRATRKRRAAHRSQRFVSVVARTRRGTSHPAVTLLRQHFR